MVQQSKEIVLYINTFSYLYAYNRCIHIIGGSDVKELRSFAKELRSSYKRQNELAKDLAKEMRRSLQRSYKELAKDLADNLEAL